ncbi:hypothetical protein [Pseudomonas sp. microsymbiont 2]
MSTEDEELSNENTGAWQEKHPREVFNKPAEGGTVAEVVQKHVEVLHKVKSDDEDD